MRRTLHVRSMTLVVCLAVLAPVGGLAESPNDGCTADPLVTCTATGSANVKTRMLSLDLGVTSPASGLLPGAGKASKTVVLNGTYRLKRSAHALGLTVRLRHTDAEAIHERPVLDQFFGSGAGTKGTITAGLSASADACSSTCKASDVSTVVASRCGANERSDDEIALSVLLSDSRRKPLRAGLIHYAISLKGEAALGAFPFGEPPQNDTGSVRASARTFVSAVQATAYGLGRFPAAQFRFGSCFDAGESPQGSATVTAGRDAVVGNGYLIRKGRGVTEFTIVAQAAGIAVGASGSFSPGWYEIKIGSFGFRIARGTLAAGDMTVASDGNTTTLKVPLPGFGKATLRFKKNGEMSPYGSMGFWSSYSGGGVAASWQIDGDMVAVEDAALSGAVGAYTVTGVDPYDKHGRAFVFRAGGGSFRTCTNCPAPY